MKNLLKCAVALTFVTAACAMDTAKDPKAAGPGYDTTKVVEIQGKVSAVREDPKGSAMEGLHLTLQAGTETLDVYIGPPEFVKVFEVTFKPGDQIRVIGAKVDFEGSKVVLARELTIGTVTILCRDKDGEPLWKYFLKPSVG